jgi:DNA-binding NarL/FixJ family response regulator
MAIPREVAGDFSTGDWPLEAQGRPGFGDPRFGARLRAESTSMPRVDGPSVAVIDPHDAIHAAVRLWCLQARPVISFAGGYRSAERFLAEHPSRSASRLSAVVFEFEKTSPPIDFTALDQLVGAGHRVIVYTQADSAETTLASLRCEVFTFLLKSEDRHHLTDAIHAASLGSPYVASRMHSATSTAVPAKRPRLGTREQEVLIAWCRAETKEDVARALSIAPATVRTHLQRIRAKYASVGRPANTKAALLARAIQDGIVRIEDL